jgi:hypothetical protein
MLQAPLRLLEAPPATPHGQQREAAVLEAITLAFAALLARRAAARDAGFVPRARATSSQEQTAAS